MKRYIKIFASLFVVFFTTLSAAPATFAASANDFTISNFEVDYYLRRDAAGISRLETEEEITAIFPDYNQNHGIYHYIKAAIADGGVQTMNGISSISVYRNGEPEDATWEKEDQVYVLKIGNASTYVHGEQTYALSYKQYDVVLDQSEGAEEWQEFYWDVNGTGWEQNIQQITARVHLTAELQAAIQPRKSCFVGTRGSLDESRCTVTETTDGFSFTATNLSGGESLALVLTFQPETFDAPVPQVSYFLVIATVIVLGIGCVLLAITLHQRAGVKDKMTYYKGMPIPPQYTPLKGYTVAELDAIAIKSGINTEVATLLELAVNHKIELVKGEKKRFGSYQWSVNVKSTAGLSADQLKTLQLLNYGGEVQDGTVIEVKSQSGNAKRMLELRKELKAAPIEAAIKHGDMSEAPKGGLSAVATIASIWLLLAWGAFGITSGISETIAAHVIGKEILPFVILVGAFILAFLIFKFHGDTTTYATRTTQGLDHSNYFEGLRLYIKMAEAERLQFLQSVEGADTSAKGIVKLYEKLLPYATLFGLEKSWSDELARYYEQNPDLVPTWYVGGMAAFSASDFHSSFSSFSSSVSTHSGTSSSSGFSGGAGGGGGGGGGGGW